MVVLFTHMVVAVEQVDIVEMVIAKLVVLLVEVLLMD